ncbi:hypothetical protein [Nostoc sp. FACHB-190]|uniref:hypothetical protein n=1 Tax=Nostoc sp. FACHB-190 TaxID=2692838 RepID=UPI0016846E6F|nr:hypothetical protein [Nostoc sp. FACHB-190]MBD2301393.1 hypothetical protein [Nostoc sp. FACHB-190]
MGNPPTPAGVAGVGWVEERNPTFSRPVELRYRYTQPYYSAVANFDILLAFTLVF